MKNHNRQTRCQKMYALIEEWQRSDLTQHRFCNQTGLSYSCFQYWRKKYTGIQRSSSDFISVQTGHFENTPVEITYPNGVHLRLSSPVGVFQLLRLTCQE